MDEPTLALTITSLAVFAVFAGLFLWGLLTGQFRNIEEPKYRMLEMTDFDNQSDDKNASGLIKTEDSLEEGVDENAAVT